MLQGSEWEQCALHTVIRFEDSMIQEPDLPKLTCLHMPKSASFICPRSRVKSRLAGFKSLWVGLGHVFTCQVAELGCESVCKLCVFDASKSVSG